MSLLRLLTAGKSLIGVRNVANSYRMRTENLLPKFESTKNPFATLPKTEPLKSAPVTSPVEVPVVLATAVSPEPVTLETISLFDAKSQTPVTLLPVVRVEEIKPVTIKPITKAEPVASPVAATPVAATVAPVAPARKPKAFGEWVKKLNPLAYIPKRQPGRNASRPKAGRTPVQGELSLEKVRVMRNDLNETDLEVVRVKPAKPASTMGVPSIPSVPSVPSPILPSPTSGEPTTWGRLTSRVFGAGTTQTR
ncbi:MAG: hypothetical protein JWR26_553 [Pedosphaera sp.]|nr:hypothetical protein [Pedosphaera sp.]